MAAHLHIDFSICSYRAVLLLLNWPFHFPFSNPFLTHLQLVWQLKQVWFLKQISILDGWNCLVVTGQCNHSINACWTFCKNFMILNKHFKKKQKCPIFRRSSQSINIFSMWHRNKQLESWQHSCLFWMPRKQMVVMQGECFPSLGITLFWVCTKKKKELTATRVPKEACNSTTCPGIF